MSKKVKVKKPRATEVKTYGDQEKKKTYSKVFLDQNSVAIPVPEIPWKIYEGEQKFMT